MFFVWKSSKCEYNFTTSRINYRIVLKASPSSPTIKSIPVYTHHDTTTMLLLIVASSPTNTKKSLHLSTHIADLATERKFWPLRFVLIPEGVLDVSTNEKYISITIKHTVSGRWFYMFSVL